MFYGTAWKPHSCHSWAISKHPKRCGTKQDYSSKWPNILQVHKQVSSPKMQSEDLLRSSSKLCVFCSTWMCCKSNWWCDCPSSHLAQNYTGQDGTNNLWKQHKKSCEKLKQESRIKHKVKGTTVNAYSSIWPHTRHNRQINANAVRTLKTIIQMWNR